MQNMQNVWTPVAFVLQRNKGIRVLFYPGIGLAFNREQQKQFAEQEIIILWCWISVCWISADAVCPTVPSAVQQIINMHNILNMHDVKEYEEYAKRFTYCTHSTCFVYCTYSAYLNHPFT
jgi:hypothetical protein